MATDEERAPWVVPRWLEQSAAWAWRLLVVAAAVLAVVALFGRLRVVVLPVLVALLLATLGAPLVRALTDRGVPRLLASWIAVLLGLMLVGAVGYLVVEGVGTRLLQDTEWESVRGEVRAWLGDGPLDLSDSDIDRLEEDVRDWFVGGVGTIDVERVRVVAEVVGGTLLTIVLSFFFVKDGPQMWAWLVRRWHPDRRPAIDVAGRAAFDSLAGYVRGVAVTGLVDAVAIGLALWLIGVPLVVPLAVLTFFGAFFPIVGATVVGALGTVVALVANGPGDAVLVALATLAVQQLEGDLIMPVVMRRTVRLHPAVVLVALAAGGALAGIAGAFVAVPVVAAIAAVLRAVDDPAADQPGGSGGR